jgi:hypothetical protein
MRFNTDTSAGGFVYTLNSLTDASGSSLGIPDSGTVYSGVGTSVIGRTAFDASTITWYMGNNSTGLSMRAFVRIGNVSYVSATPLVNTSAGVSSDTTFGTNAQLESVVVASTLWQQATFSNTWPGSLTLGTAGALPAGNIQAMGVYCSGSGVRFDSFTITMEGSIPLPAAPSGLSATAVSSSRVNLTWTDNAVNEDGYIIERKTGLNGTYTYITTVSPNTSGYMDMYLSPAEQYFYRIQGFNGAGYSAYSSEAGVITPEFAAGDRIPMSFSTYLDKLEGGWFGEMFGVSWGAPTEFNYNGVIIPAGSVPGWGSGTANGGYSQDDIYVEVPFMDTMSRLGVNCTTQDFGATFRNTSFSLWHANLQGRNNLRNGIPSPISGSYAQNIHADDIDWQIEADFAGMIAPGQISVASDIAWRGGHVMCAGDGVYGGVAVAAMHAAAFTATSVRQIVETGRAALPVGSSYRSVIDDVIASHDAGNTWEQTWQTIINKYGLNGGHCTPGTQYSVNIDAKMNGAFVFIGLLYGNGDFEQSMRIAMRCGYDSDCNPSTVGSILGNYLGLSNIPASMKSGFNRTTKFSTTNYTFDDCINLSVTLARQALLMNGGDYIGGGGSEMWYLPDKPATPMILEQWPATGNAAPVLTASALVQSGLTIQFNATATDLDGVKSYQWFFGDLSYGNNPIGTHTYTQPGAYQAVCYVTDNTGNTSYQFFQLNVTAPADGIPLVAGIDDAGSSLDSMTPTTSAVDILAGSTWATIPSLGDTADSPMAEELVFVL